MRRSIHTLVAWCLLAATGIGCSLPRAGVADLARRQEEYYGELEQMLRSRRHLLEEALDWHRRVHAERRATLLDWERDLRRAEVLLRTGSDVTANLRLLSLQLAHLNLEEIERSPWDDLDRRRAAALLEVYDEMVEGLAALRENNAVLLGYLVSSDAELALRSLDVASLVRTVVAIRRSRRELGTIEEEDEAERAKEVDRLERSMERVREILLSAFSGNEK